MFFVVAGSHSPAMAELPDPAAFLEKMTAAVSGDLKLVEESSTHEAVVTYRMMASSSPGQKIAKVLNPPRESTGGYRLVLQAGRANLKYWPIQIANGDVARPFAGDVTFFVDASGMLEIRKDRARVLNPYLGVLDLWRSDSMVLIPSFISTRLMPPEWKRPDWSGAGSVSETLRILVHDEARARFNDVHADDVVIEYSGVQQVGPQAKIQRQHSIRFEKSSSYRPVGVVESRDGKVRSRWTLRWMQFDRENDRWAPVFLRRENYWPGEGPGGTDIQSHLMETEIKPETLQIGTLPPGVSVEHGEVDKRGLRTITTNSLSSTHPAQTGSVDENSVDQPAACQAEIPSMSKPSSDWN